MEDHKDYRRKATYTEYMHAMREVAEEYFEAQDNFSRFRSRHEGIAIIEEEFLEFRAAAMWPHKNKGDDAYTEAKQLATMAIRYMVDIGHEGSHTYAPIPEPESKMSSDLDEVIHTLVHSCPNYMAGDIASPRPMCCPFHKAAWTVSEAQKVLKEMNR